MRVLHLLKTSVGASWALRQTTELVKSGVTVHLALPDGPMVEKYRAAGVKVHIFNPALSVKRPWQNIAKARELRALVDTIQPDVVHSHFVATTLLMRLALRKHRIPKIFHVPGPLHLEHAIFRRADLWSANRYDYWLASCLWTQNCYLGAGIAADKVGLAYYGVNESDFSFEPTEHRPIVKQLGLPDDVFLLGMVAFFYAPKAYLGQKRGLKGHEDLIDALQIVKRTHSNIACVFVGGPWGNSQPYFDKVKHYAQVKSPGSCFFLGHSDQVPALYPQFDLAVHPSHSENVGGAVESMYAGVATLTSNVGGFPDLVTDGETGYMANAQDPVSLAGKIIQAIDNPEQRAQLIARGREKVAQVMNVEHNAQQVLDFYQHILATQKEDANND